MWQAVMIYLWDIILWCKNTLHCIWAPLRHCRLWGSFCMYKTVYKYIFYDCINCQIWTTVSLLTDPSKHIFLRLIWKYVWNWWQVWQNVAGTAFDYKLFEYCSLLWTLNVSILSSSRLFRLFWKKLLCLLATGFNHTLSCLSNMPSYIGIRECSQILDQKVQIKF